MDRTHYNYSLHARRLLGALLLLTLLAGCSTTSALKEGEQLFVGLKPIEYTDYEPGTYADSTMLEVEAALATAPTGSLFGSSYYRTPFPVRLWIWNAFSGSEGGVDKWICKTFGSTPKLMSQVNPKLRAQVAENQLAKFGYFDSRVTYDEVTLSNPKEGKIAYHVNMGHLWRLDTLQYVGFPTVHLQLIDSTRSQALIGKGSPFNVSALEQERQRLTRLFRNNGYYYYKNGYASYLADTVNVTGKAQVRLVLSDSIDRQARKQWAIGKVNINFRNQFMEQLTDSFVRRYISFRYKGRKMPIRPGVVLRDLRLRPRSLYRVEDEEAAKSSLQSMGLFSYTELQFTPRAKAVGLEDDSLAVDTLDANIDLVFDKPYTFYVEANAKGKTTGRIGPELVVGISKLNAFRGGEKIDFNLHGSHEWQTVYTNGGKGNKINSYELGGDLSVSFPRIITPWTAFRSIEQNERRFRRGYRPTRYYGTPSTTVKASMNIINRAGYFRRHVASGELNYTWANSYQHQHSFSPIVLNYEYMNSTTAKFDSLRNNNNYLWLTMSDRMVAKMSYTYIYRSPQTYLNPIIWQTTVSEAGNLLSLGYLARGYDWNEKEKKLFKNPYAQFLKVETDFVKYWRLGEHSKLVGHINAGYIWSYGNSTTAPYTEQFYVGGANSIRAFNVRSVGPGAFYVNDLGGLSQSSLNLTRTGNVKLVANLEYRPRLFGSLYGALFLDAGNVWETNTGYGDAMESLFKFPRFLKQMAVGTGVGLRYDLDMFVIRIDWGVGLHLPYDTTRSGFYNIDSFKNAQSLHFAVGFPF